MCTSLLKVFCYHKEHGKEMWLCEKLTPLPDNFDVGPCLNVLWHFGWKETRFESGRSVFTMKEIGTNERPLGRIAKRLFLHFPTRPQAFPRAQIGNPSIYLSRSLVYMRSKIRFLGSPLRYPINLKFLSAIELLDRQIEHRYVLLLYMFDYSVLYVTFTVQNAFLSLQ